MDVLKAGGRKLGIQKSVVNTPYSAFEQGTVGECRVNSAQMAAIEHLYHSSASIQAARTILHGQLLGSGLSLTRAGKSVKLKPSFQKHLEARWLPFAREVIDATLKWGMVVVTIEEEEDPPFAAFTGKKRTSDGASKGQPGDPQSKNAAEASRAVSQAPRPVPQSTASAKNLIPCVPVIGTYEVALTPMGRAAYIRKARVFTTSPAHAYTEDPYAQTFFRTEPDVNGNVVSPIASCFDQAQFVNALRELALSAEVVRATPTLVTQSAPRINNTQNGGIDTASLFFDSESRAVQQQSATDEASERAAQLALTARLAAELNRVRTTNVEQVPGGNPGPAPTSLPPEVPPRLFALPEKQQLVPNALQPQARTDLESLMRFANDAIACSLGVPASVVFEGRFSSNSMSQLQLLNNTVSSIAIFVNSVLTACYNAIYGSEEDDTELILMVAPISANTEVQALYTSGLIDYETALPAALNSLGCSAEEIASAMDRRRKLEREEKAIKDARNSTEKEELAARSRAAKLEPRSEGSGSGSGAKALAKTQPEAPAKPASEAGDGD